MIILDRVNPAAMGSVAFCSACKNGFTEIVRLLIEDRRVNFAAEDNKPIKVASHSGHLEIVKLLLLLPSVNPEAEFVFWLHFN